jgi:cytochrome bd-type quinol oxidase subunit 2
VTDKQPDGNLPPEERRRSFARLIAIVLWVFTVAFTVGAVQVARALWSRKVWVDYRGEVVSAAAMWRELAIFALLAIVCALLAWYWRRNWRRGS